MKFGVRLLPRDEIAAHQLYAVKYAHREHISRPGSVKHRLELIYLQGPCRQELQASLSLRIFMSPHQSTPSAFFLSSLHSKL